MASDSKATAGLKTQANELIKEHIVYDGSNRPSEIYVAGSTAPDGAQCTRVRYAYVGSTSLVQYMVEDISTWDETWEII